MTLKTTSRDTQMKNKHERHTNPLKSTNRNTKTNTTADRFKQNPCENHKEKARKQVDSTRTERLLIPGSKLKEETGRMIENSGSEKREIEKASIGG